MFLVLDSVINVRALQTGLKLILGLFCLFLKLLLINVRLKMHPKVIINENISDSHLG